MTLELKVLLDNCIWSGAKKDLTEAGYDVMWVGDFLKDPGDEAVLQLAYNDNRVHGSISVSI
ncbi:MAG: hypothetical protein MUE95_08925, partial [Cyclobacteriaceae bacterium]|nr:hypothetical protein [Cyclobacteriaceae bacterium]